jgi:hypothetical protein
MDAPSTRTRYPPPPPYTKPEVSGTRNWRAKKSGIETRGTIFHKSIQVLAFADDINISGRSLRVVKEAFLNLKKAAKEIGLTINGDKTKFMEITKYPSNLCFLEVNGYKFEKITQFKYLGTSVTYDNDLSVEINNRIISANRSYYGLKKQLKSHLLSTQTKIKLYKTLVRPVLMYGCESWSLTKNEENKIKYI